MKPPFATTALALTLVACSLAPQVPGAAQSTEAPIALASEAVPSPAPTASASTARPSAATADLTLEGLGDLKFGQAVPAGGRWAERGGQVSDTCRIVSSPDYPGVYAIVESGKVHRITVGERSTVKLIQGIGVGASEARVRADFADFRATPHDYEASPAKYLTAPNASSGAPALRFEIGQNGKVSLIHVGMSPQLEYVEGCS